MNRASLTWRSAIAALLVAAALLAGCGGDDGGDVTMHDNGVWHYSDAP